MLKDGIFDLLLHVVSSWQVIVVTVGIILYLNIVFYVARSYRTPRIKSLVKQISVKRKNSKGTSATEGPETLPSGSNVNDELGLEEE